MANEKLKIEYVPKESLKPYLMDGAKADGIKRTD